MPPARRTLAACAALALALGGCSTDRGKDDPIEVVKRYIESYDRGDLAVCDELVTDRYIRALGRAAHQNGRETCEQLVRAAERLDITLDVIPAVEEKGDVVNVQARLNVNGQQVTQDMRLRRQPNGDLLVDRVDQLFSGAVKR